jgi:hypothetical protein
LVDRRDGAATLYLVEGAADERESRMTKWTKDEIAKYMENARKHHNGHRAAADDGVHYWHRASYKLKLAEMIGGRHLDILNQYCEEGARRYPLK